MVNEQEEVRWSHILKEVSERHAGGRPWWRRAADFWAWAGGIGGASALAVTVVVLIVDLFAAGRQFTALNISNWMFWTAAFLMLVGMLAPTGEDEDSVSSREDRLTRSVRKRLERMYNPWRWRLWAAAAITFGLSALVGQFASPAS